jgi:hypothetical protein
MLFRMVECAHALLIPSAHCWNASLPAGPMSLFWIVAFAQLSPPSAMCRHDHERGSNECVYSTSWPVFGPPISMFAPPLVGGAPRRVPFTCTCRILIPLHVAQVPSMAVVWPAPSATGPSTTSVARVPSEG